MMKRSLPKLVAEIGCNHMGDFSLALKMISAAAASGADYVKFQKRNLDRYRPFQDSPHPDSRNSFGGSYYEHRKNLEFSIEQHRKLKMACENAGVKYSVSVWDEESFEEVLALDPDYIKVPSAENLNFRLLQKITDSDSPVHISLGMTTQTEKEEIFRFFEGRRGFSSTVFYSCTSSYPTGVGELYLNEIAEIRDRFSRFGSLVGFSGHYAGTNLDAVAFALGATWVERHFTLDKNLKGSDQAFSLLPDELLEVKKNLKDAYAAVQSRPADILLSEHSSRSKLKSHQKSANLL